MVAIEARQQAPPTPKTMSHKSCWFDGQGHKICGDWSATSHNLTDIHHQDGVADLHNEHNSNKNETVHGVTFANDPSHPNAQFEGHKQDDNQGFRDAHDDQDEWTDHKEESGHKNQDWKLNGTTPNGGTKGEDFWYDDQYHNVTDIQDSKTDGTSETTTDDSDQSSFQADFNVDNPGDQHDEEGSLVGQHRSKHQFDEHKGPDYYDSHEETNDQTVASGSFDTYDGVADAMQDFDEHIDLPPSYGIPWEEKKKHSHAKREPGEWTIGNVNKFDVAVSHGAQPAVAHVLQTRAVSEDSSRELWVGFLCALVIGIALLSLAAILVVVKKKRAAENRAQQAERALGLMRQGREDVELQTVRVSEKKGERNGDVA